MDFTQSYYHYEFGNFTLLFCRLAFCSVVFSATVVVSYNKNIIGCKLGEVSQNYMM